jgi:transcriptional regulator with XRE-family HTH domain
MKEQVDSAGTLLRDWRVRRRLSQLALAVDAGISQRHLSFVETGRAQPSREMMLHLTECLGVPLRERNSMLVAAGYAPVYDRRPLDAPELAAARSAIDRILQGHEPHPALLVDRHWSLLAANRAVDVLLAGVGTELLGGTVNVLRLTLHPRGLAGRILNFRQWRKHILARLAREIEASADATLVALLDELRAYPVPPGALPDPGRSDDPGIVVPLVLTGAAGRLSFISTTTVFGTATDITLSEVAVESFFPADAETAAAMIELLKTR